MAIFGRDFYGLTKYGSTVAARFDVEPFLAEPVDYGQIRLTWNNPTGTWDRLRLTMSRTGYPVTPDEGEILFDSTTSNKIHVHHGASGGRFHYYTLWIRSGGAWNLSAATSALAVNNHASADVLWNQIPQYFRWQRYKGALVTDDYVTTASILDPERVDRQNSDLRSFVEVLGWGHDYVRAYHETLRNAYDLRQTHLENVDRLAQQFGVQSEYAVSPRLLRRRVESAGGLAMRRGSLEGLRDIVALTSGFDVDLQPVGDNLMLSADTSTFYHPQFPEWNPGVSYAVGDMVQFAGRIFRVKNRGARTNYCTNPSFSTLSGWAVATPLGSPVTSSTVIARDTSQGRTSATDVDGTTGSMRVSGRAVVGGKSFAYTDVIYSATGLVANRTYDATIFYRLDGQIEWTALTITQDVTATSATFRWRVPGSDAVSQYRVDDCTIVIRDAGSNQVGGAMGMTQRPAYGNEDAAQNQFWDLVRNDSSNAAEQPLRRANGSIAGWRAATDTGTAVTLLEALAVSSPTAAESYTSNALTTPQSGVSGSLNVYGASGGTSSTAEPSAQEVIEQAIPVPQAFPWRKDRVYRRGEFCMYRGQIFRALQENSDAIPTFYTTAWIEAGNTGSTQLTVSAFAHGPVEGAVSGSGPRVSIDLDFYDRYGQPILGSSAQHLGHPVAPYAWVDSFNRNTATDFATRAIDYTTHPAIDWTVDQGTWGVWNFGDDERAAYPRTYNGSGRALSTIETNVPTATPFVVGVTFGSAAPAGKQQALIVGYADANNFVRITRTRIERWTNGSLADSMTFTTPLLDGDRVTAAVDRTTATYKFLVYTGRGETYTFYSATSRTWSGVPNLPNKHGIEVY